MGKEEIGHIILFGGLTGVYPRDCIIDRKRKRVILVVERDRVGLAMGRRGKNLRRLKDATGYRYEIAEYPTDLMTFLENSLKPVKPREIGVLDHPRRGKIAFVSVKARERGACLGKDGRNIEKISMLAKRYFIIDGVKVVTSESAKRVKELKGREMAANKKRMAFDRKVADSLKAIHRAQEALEAKVTEMEGKVTEKHNAIRAAQEAAERKRMAFEAKVAGSLKA